MKLLISNYLNEDDMFEQNLQNKLLWRIPHKELKNNGWTVIGRNDIINIENLIKKIEEINPSIIFFWFQSEYSIQIRRYIMYIVKWANKNKVKLVSYIDDLHFNRNKERNLILNKILNTKTALLFGSYMYAYDQYHSIQNNINWLPHCFYDSYKINLNNNPIKKILLTGVNDKKIYPMRQKMFDLIDKYPIIYQQYCGYDKPKHNICGKKYTELLNNYLISFTCCSSLKTPYLLSKFFEISGSGSLLLAYDKHVKDQMKELGFINMVNYICVTEDNIEEKIQFVLDEKNLKLINKIRKCGYDLVNNNHMLSHRATYIDRTINKILGCTKILLLTTFPLSKLEFKLSNCKIQYHIIAYMINKYMKTRKNIEVILYECSSKGTSSRFNEIVDQENFPYADHAILIDNRGLINRVDKFYDLLRPKITGAICTFSASNVFTGKEDILYYMIPSGKSNKRRCKLINWACNHELCSPNQDRKTLRILIDHNYYGPHINMLNADRTDEITEQVCEFAKNYKEKEIIVRRFIKGGVETVDIHNVSKLEKYKQGLGLNYEEVCKEYSKTDIFFVTHKECMGLSVLESAMAGALIVTPGGYIKKELINKIHHIELEDVIIWDDILHNLDIEKSRNSVLTFNWDKAVSKIYETLINFDKYVSKDMRFRNYH